MPSYTWECNGCKQIQVVVKKMSEIDEGPATACTLCGAREYTRIVSSGGGFILSGKGWFKKGGY
jgi:putative FmdB family regulatory protein